MSHLAIRGGTPHMKAFDLPAEMFRWPIIDEASENAVLDVLRTNRISGSNITVQFEREFAAWNGTKHAVCACNGTMALEAAYFAAGIKVGDEIICPTKTYWATCLSAQKLGAAVVFANVDPDTVSVCGKTV